MQIKLMNVFILCMTLILVLIFAEIGLRIFFPVEDIFIENDPLLGYRHIPNKEGYWMREVDEPNKIKINSKGLRDTEHEYEHKNNTFRIMLLGDSYIQAFQVKTEEMLSKKLETLLNSKLNTQQFEVINTGVQGYSTGIEQLYFQTEGIKYDPDIVILYFFVGNDIFENYYKTASNSKPGWKIEQGKLIKIEPQVNKWYVMLRDHVLTKLHLCKLTRIAINNMQIKSITNLADKTGMLSGVYKPITHEEDKKEAMAITEQLLLNTHSYIQELNKTFVVFLIPDGAIFYPDFSAEFVQENKDDVQKIIRFLNISKIAYINPYAVYSTNINKSQEIYINKRGHWSKAGHEVSAQLTFDFLLNNKLIPIPAKINK